MAIAPGDQRDLALQIKTTYEQAELDMLELIARRLAKGMKDNDWARRRLSEARHLVDEVKAILGDIDKGIDINVEDALNAAWDRGRDSVDKDLLHLTVGDTRLAATGSLGGTTTRAVGALARATVMNIRMSHFQILRSVNDIYRTSITQTSGKVLAGTHTVREAVQESLNRFADSGISGFIDKRGRKWDLAAYAEMSVRTATGRAAVDGALRRMGERGHKLVIVSNHAEECPICRPWEGKILDAGDGKSGHPSVGQATGSGLFHPNCRHTMTAYIEGFTRVPEGPLADPEGYRRSQKERYLERGVRKWQRRMAATVTPEEKQAARQKFLQWTSALNAHPGRGRIVQPMIAPKPRTRTITPKTPKTGVVRMGHENLDFGLVINNVSSKIPDSQVHQIMIQRAKAAGHTISESDASHMFDAIRHYAGGGFDSVRKGNNPEAVKWLNQFIQTSPKFAEQPLYRGVRFADNYHADKLHSFVDSLKVGHKMDLGEVSSWTSNIDVANKFARSTYKNFDSVLIKMPKTDSGASIQHISLSHYEDEVLLPKKQYEIKSVEKVKKKTGDKYQYVVEVKEVDI